MARSTAGRCASGSRRRRRGLQRELGRGPHHRPDPRLAGRRGPICGHRPHRERPDRLAGAGVAAGGDRAGVRLGAAAREPRRRGLPDGGHRRGVRGGSRGRRRRRGVTPIRPLEPDDIPAVAGLYERVLRSGGGRAPVALEAFFRDEVLEQPWADPDIPSLVYESDGAILGVLASHVRRFLLDGRPLRVGYSGPLVADPDADKPGVGALLMRSHMRGAQEASATDGATSVVRAMWERLGGVTVPTASLGWTRV